MVHLMIPPNPTLKWYHTFSIVSEVETSPFQMGCGNHESSKMEREKNLSSAMAKNFVVDEGHIIST
jgi:hypothetical protein